MQFDLEEIKDTIARQYNWGPTANWTNFHFKELSKAIEAATGDRLSEETLKRIFGKRKVNSETYHPQAFSQLALQKFIDSFKTSGEVTDSKNQKKSLAQRFKSKNMLFLFLLPVVLILLFFISLQFRETEKYSFQCINPRDFSPFTATFNYDVSEIEDSVFTDFGNKEETYLPPGKTMINYFYSNPGDYQLRFYTRSRMLDSLRVLVWSRDWQAGFFPNSKPDQFLPFHNQQFYRHANYFYATEVGLNTEGVDLKLRSWTEYQYFYPFQKSLDELTLETRILNNSTTGSLTCFDAEIVLLGDSGSVNFKFTQPKCARWASLRVSEKFLDGKYTDLSAFTVDMSDWLQIRMSTGKNTCKIYLNEKYIFTQKYDRRMGILVGVVYRFYGSGKIDYLDLKDLTGNTFYTSEFGAKF
jgi:hypothetical protein